MIELIDDWVIVVDECCYALGKREKPAKDGRFRYKAVGYFPTVSSALNRFRDELVRERLKNSVAGLVEAIAALKKPTSASKS